MSGHLDLDALADALAGEPSAHLSGCADCASRLAELQAAEVQVAATLAALPAPALPDGLAERLQAAVRAEPAGASVLPMVPRSTRRRLLLPTAAAAVLAVTGVGLGLALTGSGTTADRTAASDSAGGGTFASAPVPQAETGTDYADPAAVTTALPTVLDGSLERSTTSLDTESAPLPVAESDPLARLRTPEGLADCLSALADPAAPDSAPLAVDFASYAGQPALAVLLPDPDPAQVQVFVVGAGCTAGADGTLFFTRLPRP